MKIDNNMLKEAELLLKKYGTLSIPFLQYKLKMSYAMAKAIVNKLIST